MTSLEMVKQLHETFGHPIENRPSKEVRHKNRALRLALLQEELAELRDAIYLGDDELILDALCDLQVVLDGAFLALGFWRVKDESMAEVHRSNMSKLGADGKPVLREDGKFLKGPNYSPPNLGPILDKMFQEEGILKRRDGQCL